MVKMQAVQSALAIRRQRSRREEVRKAKLRRESGISLATPRPSIVSLDGRVYFDEKKNQKRWFGQVTMFHVGAVFIVIGLMLVITSLMPQYVQNTTPQRRNDVLGTGCFFVFLGGVLTTVSRFVSNSEEEELNEYIKGRLSRSRSGHRLATLDPDAKREQPQENGVHKLEVIQPEPSCASEKPEEPTEVIVEGSVTASASTEPVLSRILEEDEIDVDISTTEPVDSTPDSSLTPTSPVETQGLLEKHCSPRKSSKASSIGSFKGSKHS